MNIIIERCFNICEGDEALSFFTFIMISFILFEILTYTHKEIKSQADIPIEDLYKFSHVNHPNTIYKKSDLERAKRNVELFEWAATRNRSIINSAKYILRYFNDSFIQKFIPRTTPSTTTFCPNCYATGKNWHANGDWSWSYQNPDVIKCNVCGMQFPNAQYPETLRIKSTWDPEQEFSYVDNDPVQCMSYKVCRSSMEGVIRGKKLTFLVNQLLNLALGYFVSNDSEYAKYVQKALFRLAEVMPKYLVYAGYSYSEYCDVDPHEAVKDPSKVDKFIFAPGNEEKTGLYHTYWAASRLGTSGMDGQIVKILAQAYDLTVDAVDLDGKPIYSEEDKVFISKNCLIEGALLGFYDTLINNKAVYNRQGVALVGLATGSTLMTRFGMDGFIRTFNEWYLPDGGTPESASYDMMTVEGIYLFGYMLRDYSDPDDFVPGVNETKYSHFDPFKDTIFDEVVQDLLWTTDGDFMYPPIADTYAVTTLSTKYLDFMLLGFQTETVHSYFAERSKGVSPTNDALFFRSSDLNFSDFHPFDVPDIVFPYLSQGFLRTGEFGRKSTVVLDASNYGSHHHIDSLNIVYKKDGRELLNDLGYLWDHANHSLTVNTNIHNTVFIDHQNQLTNNRNGSFHLFISHGNVKAMQASSNAYKVADVYNRTIVQIEHKSGKSYLVDIFRASGGKTREYVFHGVHHDYTMNQQLVFDREYKVDYYSGVVRLSLNTLGGFDITNVIIRRRFSNGSFGPNIVQPIPEKFDGVKCPENGTWCNYRGNGWFDWKVTNDGPKGERAVHFESTSPDDSGRYNVALNIGNCNGYTCPVEKGLSLASSSEYEIEFMMKGQIAPSFNVQYWSIGNELNTSARLYYNIRDLADIKLTNEWQKFKGTFRLGASINALGAETSEELKIKWKIDQNYTFSSFIPARDKQLIFYEEGFGQRDHKNSDFGVTVPNFYIYRDEPNETSVFVNVFEGNFNDQLIVKDVEITEVGNGSVAIRIETIDGDDHVLSSFDGQKIDGYKRSTDARLAVELGEDAESTVMFDGSFFQFPSGKLEFSGKIDHYKGQILGFHNTDTESWYEIDSNDLWVNNIDTRVHCIYVTGDDGKNIERAYPILKIEKNGKSKLNIFTRVHSEGFRTHQTQSWRITMMTDMNSPHKLNDSSKLPPGAIAAIVIVVILVVVGVGVAVGIILYRKKKKAKSEESAAEEA